MTNFKEALETKLKANGNKYTISGVVSQDGTVYPLGSDTKVLSTIFELFTRPLMIELAHDLGVASRVIMYPFEAGRCTEQGT